MAQFDKNKVISYLCLNEADVGKKYYFSDNLYELKLAVENEHASRIGKLDSVVDGEEPFQKDNNQYWGFIYPYEEPPKKRIDECLSVGTILSLPSDTNPNSLGIGKWENFSGVQNIWVRVE